MTRLPSGLEPVHRGREAGARSAIAWPSGHPRQAPGRLAVGGAALRGRP